MTKRVQKVRNKINDVFTFWVDQMKEGIVLSMAARGEQADEETFKAMDENNDQLISRREFRRACERLGFPREHLGEADELYSSFDRDGSGEVDYNELNKLFVEYIGADDNEHAASSGSPKADAYNYHQENNFYSGSTHFDDNAGGHHDYSGNYNNYNYTDYAGQSNDYNYGSQANNDNADE